jgi:hypothetical protein
MKTSNLAERLDEFDDIIDSLRLSGEPTIRMVAEGGASADGGERGRAAPFASGPSKSAIRGCARSESSSGRR